MSQEFQQPNPEVAIPADQVFMRYDQMLGEFQQRVQNGDITFQAVTEMRDANASGGTIWLNNDDQTVLDTEQKQRLREWRDAQETHTNNFTREEVEASTIPEDLKTGLIAALDAKDMRSAFNVKYAQNTGGTFWLAGDGRKNPGEWVFDAKLVDFTEVEVGDEKLAVSFHTDKVDPDEISRGISEVVATLAKAGLDLTKVLKWINIVDEDSYSDFQIPAHILEKHPTAYVAAQARLARAALTLNAKMFVNREKKSPEGQDLVVSERWEDTLIHEIGHLYNGGLIDMADATPAVDIGWRRRDGVTTDNYGDLIETKDPADPISSSTYITDDYGNQVYIGNAAPQQLVTGGMDASGNAVTPPSKYAAENSSEDIAESFSAYFSGAPLDDVRRAAIEKIITDHRTLDAGHVPDVSFKQIKPDEVDIWNYLPKHIRLKRADVFL